MMAFTKSLVTAQIFVHHIMQQNLHIDGIAVNIGSDSGSLHKLDEPDESADHHATIIPPSEVPAGETVTSPHLAPICNTASMPKQMPAGSASGGPLQSREVDITENHDLVIADETGATKSQPSVENGGMNEAACDTIVTAVDLTEEEKRKVAVTVDTECVAGETKQEPLDDLDLQLADEDGEGEDAANCAGTEDNKVPRSTEQRLAHTFDDDDKRGLNTKFVVLRNDVVTKLLCPDPEKKGFTRVNLERLNRLQTCFHVEEKAKKFIHSAKLSEWRRKPFSGNKVLYSYTLPAKYVAGYTDDDQHKKILKEMSKEHQEKIRQQKEKQRNGTVAENKQEHINRLAPENANPNMIKPATMFKKERKARRKQKPGLNGSKGTPPVNQHLATVTGVHLPTAEGDEQSSASAKVKADAPANSALRLFPDKSKPQPKKQAQKQRRQADTNVGATFLHQENRRRPGPTFNQYGHQNGSQGPFPTNFGSHNERTHEGSRKRRLAPPHEFPLERRVNVWENSMRNSFQPGDYYGGLNASAFSVPTTAGPPISQVERFAVSREDTLEEIRRLEQELEVIRKKQIMAGLSATGDSAGSSSWAQKSHLTNTGGLADHVPSSIHSSQMSGYRVRTNSSGMSSDPAAAAYGLSNSYY